MSSRYPLEAARKLRAQEVEEKKAELGAALAGVSAHEEKLEREKAALSEHQALRAKFRREERGGGDGAELMRRVAYEQRLASEERDKKQHVEDAQNELRNAERAADAARASLAQARAEAEAVEKHHQRWLAEQKQRAERAEEAEADDLASSRHS